MLDKLVTATVLTASVSLLLGMSGQSKNSPQLKLNIDPPIVQSLQWTSDR
ncbi:MAG: hypothetical protein NW220_23905 [Leptolyngbyaceae cyanobacterium bins.349]|nr:hypothetical protein [Leptolyngbyaceae cyanobacterium bins.349]